MNRCAIIIMMNLGFAIKGFCGQYSIVSADLYDPTAETNVSTVLKIELETGKTWRLQRMAMPIEGRSEKLLVEGWVEVTDSFAVAYQKAERLLGKD